MSEYDLRARCQVAWTVGMRELEQAAGKGVYSVGELGNEAVDGQVVHSVGLKAVSPMVAQLEKLRADAKVSILAGKKDMPILVGLMQGCIEGWTEGYRFSGCIVGAELGSEVGWVEGALNGC